MGLIKIFSGSEVMAMALQKQLEDNNINTMLKNNIQSARLGGFGNADLAVEIFIQEIDYGKASPVLENFRMSI